MPKFSSISLENVHERELYPIFRGEVDIDRNSGWVSRSSAENVRPDVTAHLLRGQSFNEVDALENKAHSAGAKAPSFLYQSRRIEPT